MRLEDEEMVRMGFGDARSDRETAELVMGPARELIAVIRMAAEARDHARAHSLEDDLYEMALRLMADESDPLDAEEMRELARLLLTTQEIEFARWCA